MIIRYPKLMEMIRSACMDVTARQIEIYLRKEAVLSFISGKKTILDFGCGHGVTSVYLSVMGHKVTGMDCSESELDFARGLAARYAVEVNFQACASGKMDIPDGSYDLIICEETLEHLEDPLDMLKKFIQILKHGGRLLISVPNAEGIRARLLSHIGMKDRLYCRDHKQDFTIPVIKALLAKAGFKDIFITSDFLAIPKLPLDLFIEKRKYLARLKPSLGHHIIAYGEKND